MLKFKKVYETLLAQGLITEQQVHTPGIASLELLQTVHHPEYVKNFCLGKVNEEIIRRIGLPWSPGLVQRTRTAVAGTLLTAELALKYGIACNTAGGTHHAFPNYGAGFCIFNDLAVTARFLLDQNKVNKILIVDLDVHQGDGTAFIFQNEPRVFTFSMHCSDNYPFTKQKSDMDIGLPQGTEDQVYLKLLYATLPPLLKSLQPDLVIYDAGVDIYKNDPLGKLSISYEGIYKRDLFVLQSCVKSGIPVACVIGGGYCKDLQELCFRHALLFQAALEIK